MTWTHNCIMTCSNGAMNTIFKKWNGKINVSQKWNN